MLKHKTADALEPSELPDDGDAPQVRDGRQLPPDAVALLVELAERGRARRREVEAHGTPPWEAIKDHPAWQQRWDDLLARIRGELPAGITPEEIEAEITRVTEELRNERLASRR